MFETFNSLAFSSPMFLAAVALTVALTLDATSRLRELRFIFAGLVYLTTALWYFVDPVYQPREYEKFTPAEFDFAYLQVALFLLGFRLLLPALAPATPTRVLRDFDPRQLDRGPVVGAIFVAWAGLFLVGIAMANFEVLEVMFPIQGRANWNTMFARGRYGGATGFLTSAAAYSYMMVCSGFGVIFVCSRRTNIRTAMGVMMAFTWPMFILSGSRHHFLAVALPTILAALLTKPWTRMQRVAFLAGCGVAMNIVMLAVITFRNDGLGRIFSDEGSVERIAKAKHLGLNMPEEMMYILRYQESGRLPVDYGGNYFEHAVNFIPRPLWPDKPMPGLRFAVLRMGLTKGYAVTTLSYGFIGQGVANFGPYLGPFAPAFLLALMCRFLCRLRYRGDPFIRASLVLFCLGLLPNLGRDISLLVLWPAIFGYAGGILYESLFASKRAIARPRRPTMSPALSSFRSGPPGVASPAANLDSAATTGLVIAETVKTPQWSPAKQGSSFL